MVKQNCRTAVTAAAAGGQHETLTVGLEAAGTGMVTVGLGDKGQNKCRQKNQAGSRGPLGVHCAH